MKIRFLKVNVRQARSAAVAQGLYPDATWEKTLLIQNDGDNTIRKKAGDISLEFAQRIINPAVDNIAARIQAVAAQAADAEVQKFFNWIGHMLGTETTPPELAEMGILWKPLSPRYAAMKKGSGFFVSTGKLRRQFYARSGLKIFGKTELVPLGPSSRAPNGLTQGARAYGGVKMNTIKLRVMPKLGDLATSATNAAGLEKLMYGLGLSDLEQRKLQGRRNYFRPLLGPALVYFMRVKLPVAVRQELRKKGYSINSVGKSVNSGLDKNMAGS